MSQAPLCQHGGEERGLDCPQCEALSSFIAAHARIQDELPLKLCNRDVTRLVAYCRDCRRRVPDSHFVGGVLQVKSPGTTAVARLKVRAVVHCPRCWRSTYVREEVGPEPKRKPNFGIVNPNLLVEPAPLSVVTAVALLAVGALLILALLALLVAW